MYLNESNELIVCPNFKYFNSDWETNEATAYPTNQNIASNQIKAHFKALKDMGFNSVRIMNCQVRTRWDSDILTTRLYFKNFETVTNPDPERAKEEFGIRKWEVLTDLEAETEKNTIYKQCTLF